MSPPPSAPLSLSLSLSLSLFVFPRRIMGIFVHQAQKRSHCDQFLSKGSAWVASWVILRKKKLKSSACLFSLSTFDDASFYAAPAPVLHFVTYACFCSLRILLRQGDGVSGAATFATFANPQFCGQTRPRTLGGKVFPEITVGVVKLRIVRTFLV